MRDGQLFCAWLDRECETMRLETLSPHSIISISQKALLFKWNRLARGQSFPDIADFIFDERIHDPNQLVVWNIEQNEGARQFRAAYQGRALTEAFGAIWSGKTMDEVLPEFIRQFAIDTASECASSRCAIYTVLSTKDAAGHRVDCERLLLPFGRDGEEVQQIVASLQLISLRGSFKRNSVIDSYRIDFGLSVAGRIFAGFKPPLISKAGDQSVEKVRS